MVGGLLLEEGLFLRYAHLNCRDAIRVLRPARRTTSGMIFSLCYLLTPGAFRFPDGELVPISESLRAAELSGFGQASGALELLHPRQGPVHHLRCGDGGARAHGLSATP